ncbi:UDP-N-acetylmuramoyl-L-alanine--D-glutamate ligase [Thiotrichales bacterium 19S9-12]|nr:UDP-N-acetylmuramoyl-L-alanine--D-glutamate ligase [Thiotrichales bacterium 19S9-11]MCF6811707.1 UDP-N-acetylmuramoyl-L-alanine--D-glutamate ligase [Thiotrichales bacterium 19S9-12]
MNKRNLYYQNKHIKKILILGLGISAISTIKFLKKNYQLQLIIYDESTSPKGKTPNKEQLKHIIDTNHFDLVIASPGFDLRAPRFQPLQALSCPIICDIELFSSLTDKPIIAITGSNGKSTVTTLVTDLLNALEVKAAKGGNIGIGVFDIFEENVDVFVIEISSFQLELLEKFSADIGILTNISEDHLDRYDSFKAYQQTKLQLAPHSKCFICNDEVTSFIRHENLKSLSINQLETSKPFSIFNGYLTYKNTPIISMNEIPLKGKHNWFNLILSLMAVNLFINPEKSKKHITQQYIINSITKSLINFKPLPSRCEIVTTINDIIWIDDSKGTNPGATQAAIAGLCHNNTNQNCLLILGGDSKNSDFTLLQPQIDQHAKAIFLFGRDRKQIKQQIAHPHIYTEEYLDKLLPNIIKIAKPHDIVLFSPACASFDQFDNYLKRGQYFKKLVAKLKQHMEV